MAPAPANTPAPVDARPGKRKRSSARVASRSVPDAEPEVLGATLPTAGPSALNTLPAAVHPTQSAPKGRKSARLHPPVEPARAPSADSDIVVVDGPPPMASLPLEAPTPPDVKPVISASLPSATATPVASSSTLPPGPEPRADSEIKMTEEEYDIQHHKQITAKRNFDKVNFGQWQIKTWYFSPYPLSETEPDATPPAADARIPGVTRATVRSHGRTSDLLAGGLGRAHAAGEALLWVCDRCFKYMADGTSYEAHTRRCTRKHPPGEKVYQRGAHTIWEVDGAKEKLYCQNLSLFGKLFIDVKTLFFDCDNFLFYLLTDADSQRDHVLGFFSKEKMSYDGYNLACIIAFPPYQRKGYGMLMIEFSYELSRRAGRVGTPERPLSELGLRSYLTYWTSTILRYFRHILSVLPADTQRITSTNGVQDFSLTQSPAPEADASSSTARKRRKTKGWDGEAHAISAPPPPPLHAAHALTRTLETRANPDGSATTHASVRCSLENIARATNLRIEDAAFAMSECGLLRARTTVGGQETVVITRELVETLARERGLKRMCMEIQHVLLP